MKIFVNKFRILNYKLAVFAVLSLIMFMSCSSDSENSGVAARRLDSGTNGTTSIEDLKNKVEHHDDTTAELKAEINHIKQALDETTEKAKQAQLKAEQANIKAETTKQEVKKVHKKVDDTEKKVEETKVEAQTAKSEAQKAERKANETKQKVDAKERQDQLEILPGEITTIDTMISEEPTKKVTESVPPKVTEPAPLKVTQPTPLTTQGIIHKTVDENHCFHANLKPFFTYKLTKEAFGKILAEGQKSKKSDFIELSFSLILIDPHNKVQQNCIPKLVIKSIEFDNKFSVTEAKQNIINLDNMVFIHKGAEHEKNLEKREFSGTSELEINKDKLVILPSKHTDKWLSWIRPSPSTIKENTTNPTSIKFTLQVDYKHVRDALSALSPVDTSEGEISDLQDLNKKVSELESNKKYGKLTYYSEQTEVKKLVTPEISNKILQELLRNESIKITLSVDGIEYNFTSAVKMVETAQSKIKMENFS